MFVFVVALALIVSHPSAASAEAEPPSPFEPTRHDARRAVFAAGTEIARAPRAFEVEHLHHPSHPAAHDTVADAHADEHEGFHHHHASPLGTPQVHGFLTEPAFLGRDVLLSLARTGGDERETELEAEVEWALSERWLLVVGVPYAWSDDDEGTGSGELGLRRLAVECPRFLLSVQANLGVPTRDDQSVTLGGSLLAWIDLGGDVTLQLDLGVEHDVDESLWEAPFAVTLAWTTPLRSPFGRWSCERHAHGAEPRLTLLAEVGGAVPIDDDGDVSLVGLLGATLPLTSEIEVRAGWLRGLCGPDDGWDGFVVGAVIHL